MLAVRPPADARERYSGRSVLSDEAVTLNRGGACEDSSGPRAGFALTFATSVPLRDELELTFMTRAVGSFSRVPTLASSLPSWLQRAVSSVRKVTAGSLNGFSASASFSCTAFVSTNGLVATDDALLASARSAMRSGLTRHWPLGG